MSRDFEFKQLLRAYRNGVISQSTFEAEMTWLEAGAPTNGNGNGGGGFKAFGRTYKSERAAVISFLDKVRVGEANGGEAFSAWAEVCTTNCIRTGIRMVAEREAYHSRVFAQRLAELGGETRATITEDGTQSTPLTWATRRFPTTKNCSASPSASASRRTRSNPSASSPHC